MATYVYDENGYIGDFATNKGTKDVFDYLRDLNNPYLQQFIEEGWDIVPEALLETLEELEPPRGDIKITIDVFKETLKKCKGIIIISDGVTHDLTYEEKELIDSRPEVPKEYTPRIVRPELFESPQCVGCKWKEESEVVCNAFPDGIPLKVLNNEVIHDHILEGQVGEQIFEKLVIDEES
jgi:hypothetical protein